MTVGDISVFQKDAGHVALKLPPLPKVVSDSTDPGSPRDAAEPPTPIADIRTKDGVHLSPRKLHTAVAKLVQTALVKHGIAKDNVQTVVSLSFFYIDVIIRQTKTLKKGKKLNEDKCFTVSVWGWGGGGQEGENVLVLRKMTFGWKSDRFYISGATPDALLIGRFPLKHIQLRGLGVLLISLFPCIPREQ
jgi:hypothetical protein